MGNLAGAATSSATESTGTVLTPSPMSEIAGHGFYCSRLRPARLATYLEALETAEEEPHADHFTVLPPRDGDVGDAESDLEDVPDDLEKEDGFEVASNQALLALDTSHATCCY